MKMKNLNKKTKLKAFSMNEVLIVLVIVGILSSIAIASYDGLIIEAYRKEAETNLEIIKTHQNKYYMTEREYSNELEKIKFKHPTKKAEGGNSNWTYSILEAGKTSFIAQAVSDKDYDGDGVFEVIEINQIGKINIKIED
ncbi:MAG: general secretion pathway protein GspG [Flavobacteriales bacterium]|nr:general secretion pathway protein GspG [Flavobacteriales bacterium]|tara:strand:+ start:201 stop:620 length:420 start_codon:yes stop_codon:yes gene_type:complete